MINRLMVNNLFGANRVFTLGQVEDGVVCDNIDGLGPVEADLDTMKSVANGSHFLGHYVGNRNIVLNFIISRTKTKTVEEVRTELYRFFRPGYGVDLTITSDTKIGYVYGQVESVTPNIFDKESSVQVSIIANPYFINETIGNDYVNLPNNKTNSIVKYLGSIPNGIEIEIEVVNSGQHLPTNITFYELVAGPNQTKSMSFVMSERDIQNAASISSYKFTNGDVIFITTAKGNKTAKLRRGGVEYNIIDAVKKAELEYLPSDQWPMLFPFASAHSFRYEGTDRLAASAFRVRVYWETLFEGY